MSLDTPFDTLATVVTVVLIALATLAVLRLLVADAVPREVAPETSPPSVVGAESAGPVAGDLVAHGGTERSEPGPPAGGQGA